MDEELNEKPSHSELVKLYNELYEEALKIKNKAEQSKKVFGIIIGEKHKDVGPKTILGMPTESAKESLVIEVMICDIAKRLGIRRLVVESDKTNLNAFKTSTRSDWDNLNAYYVMNEERKNGGLDLIPGDPKRDDTRSDDGGENREIGIKQTLSGQTESFVAILGVSHIASIQGNSNSKIAASNQPLKFKSNESSLGNSHEVLYINAANHSQAELLNYGPVLEKRINYYTDPANAFQATVVGNMHDVSMDDAIAMAYAAASTQQAKGKGFTTEERHITNNLSILLRNTTLNKEIEFIKLNIIKELSLSGNQLTNLAFKASLGQLSIQIPEKKKELEELIRITR